MEEVMSDGPLLQKTYGNGYHLSLMEVFTTDKARTMTWLYYIVERHLGDVA